MTERFSRFSPEEVGSEQIRRLNEAEQEELQNLEREIIELELVEGILRDVLFDKKEEPAVVQAPQRDSLGLKILKKLGGHTDKKKSIIDDRSAETIQINAGEFEGRRDEIAEILESLSQKRKRREELLGANDVGLSNFSDSGIIIALDDADIELVGEQEPSSEVSLEKAREIMGDNFFGPEEVKRAFGDELHLGDIPPIPYSAEALEKAKERDERLILRVRYEQHGKLLTMAKLSEIILRRLNLIVKSTYGGEQGRQLNMAGLEKSLLGMAKNYKNENFYNNDPLKTEWKLVSNKTLFVDSDELKNVDFNSTKSHGNYVHQTRALRDWLRSVGSLTKDEENECSDAVLENFSEDMGVSWKTQEIVDKSKYNKESPRIFKKLANLKVNQNHRQSPAEILYDEVLKISQSKYSSGNLSSNYIASRALSSDGKVVFIGCLSFFNPGVKDFASIRYDSLDGVMPVR